MDPSEHGRRLFNMGTTVNGNEAMEKPHTLEDYAIDHFRPPPKVGFILFYCEIELHILKRYKKYWQSKMKDDIFELFLNLCTKHVQSNKQSVVTFWLN